MRLNPSLTTVCLTLLASLQPTYAITTLTDDDLRNIPSAGTDFDIHNGKLLAPILIPRVPGSEGIFKVQQHFVDFFTSQLPDWELLWQNSTSKTPVTGDKEVPFSNLILRRDPPWAQTGDVGRLTLVAHYDSKIEPKDFIGAIDSAAPCAILMHVARNIDRALTEKWKDIVDKGDDSLEEAHGVQIIFLDGEEAFLMWSDEDSLYGARSLAEEWEKTMHVSQSTYRSPIDSISLFVLLDLLGATDAPIPSYFTTTHWAYKNMAASEKRLRDLGLLRSKPKQAFLPQGNKKASELGRGFISDDHLPFMLRGVHVLHLIPSPFPTVWHKIEDDGEHLDLDVVEDWAKVVTAFTAEWMDLQGFLPGATITKEKRSEAATGSSSKKTEL